MDQAQKFRHEFGGQSHNNTNNPADAARFMATVRDFLELVRENAFRGADGEGLMTGFCGYVNDPKVWSHAEKVAPEFRMSWEENISKQSATPADYTCLNYVLKRIHHLPRDNEIHVLTTEQDMIKKRFKSFAYNVFTGSNVSVQITPEEEELVEKIDNLFDGISRIALVTSHCKTCSSLLASEESGLGQSRH